MHVKEELFIRGIQRITNFSLASNFHIPNIHKIQSAPRGVTCAYYDPRKSEIFISIHDCAWPVKTGGGRCWSYPGYIVDRTPYGVLAHETGHHMESLLSRAAHRAISNEKPITGYAPNRSEIFAEMARLFITNADLLHGIRPRAFQVFADNFQSVSAPKWEEELINCPVNIFNAAKEKSKFIQTSLF